MGSEAPPPLPWRRRLEPQVIGGITLLVAFSLTAILVATTRTLTARSLERASIDLETARTAFDRLTDDQSAFAAAQAVLVTRLPVFRAHMSDPRLAADFATLEAMADEYRQQLKADFCVVTDHTGRWTARAGWPLDHQPPDVVRGVIAKAVAGEPSRAITVVGGGLFLLVSEPARFADEVVGTLTVGVALDDLFASRLAELTNSEVTLVADRHVYASSLTGATRAALSSLVDSDGGPASSLGAVTNRVLAGHEYVYGEFPLDDGERGRLVLLQDWEPVRQSVNELRFRLLVTGLAIFAIAVGVGVLFSRRMIRPLQDIANAAGHIAAGDWSRRVPVRGSAESILMAHAFNDMTQSLLHWYKEARERDDQLRQAQKMEAIGRLAGGVAHDFNNLLTLMRGYAQMLEASMQSDDARLADVHEILEAADRAAGLTRQLLAFGRRQLVTPRPLALDAIVKNLQQMLRRLLDENIEFTSTAPPDLWRVRADAGQMEQVVINLAINGRDAMPDGGTLHIELTNEVLGERLASGGPHLPAGSYVRLSVTDTGCGMDQEMVSRIFEPFFTTKPEGRGTGLGLATVYSIVVQAGGAIDVDTEVGRGTTFHVYLPRTTELDVATEAGEGERSIASPLREAATILLVEDDHKVRGLIANSLTRAGYSVLSAAGGEEALDIVRAHPHPIQLLLTDVVMPGLNGREVSERVLAIRPSTRILFMSGHSDDSLLKSGIETSSTHFIQKPFPMEALASKIFELLRGTVQ
jgi:signal transduction histidine kinase/CheY-like chemotaxis protein